MLPTHAPRAASTRDGRGRLRVLLERAAGHVQPPAAGLKPTRPRNHASTRPGSPRSGRWHHSEGVLYHAVALLRWWTSLGNRAEVRQVQLGVACLLREADEGGSVRLVPGMSASAQLRRPLLLSALV